MGRLEFRLASRLARRLVVPAGALLVFASFSGCGSGDESASASSDQQRAEKARLDFARCMRQHGVDIPDPTGDRPGEIAIRIKGRADTPQFQRAQKACDKYLQAARPKLSAEDRAKFRDAFVKFSACMRKEGVDLPDPTTSGGGPQRSTSESGGPGPGSGPSRQAMIGGAKINLDDPRVRKAMDKCRKLLPNGGPGGERRTGGGSGPDLTRSAGG